MISSCEAFFETPSVSYRLLLAICSLRDDDARRPQHAVAELVALLQHFDHGALFLLGRLDLGIYRSEALRCAFAFLAGAALVAAAIYLEHILKVPPEQPGDGKVPSGA